jgi:hypothetical protein
MKKTTTPLSLRAFHLDLKWQHYRFDDCLALLDDLGDWGYNAVVLEYENMFPYRCCRRAVHKDAWTMQQVRRFVEKAASRKIQVIPLIQCFGHLEFVLRLPTFRHMAEDPGKPAELCPCKEGTADLVHAMIQEVLDADPEAPYLHIGGDEVWTLGTCRRCKQNVARIGKSRIYIDFVSPFIERVLRAGKRPILWADMLLSHPEALDGLSRMAILCDWEYWPQAVVEPYVHDWSSGTWVTPMTLSLETPATVKRFRSHWALPSGSDWPARYKGYPYVSYLQKAGFEVIIGSSMKSGGDNYSAVKYPWHVHNCVSAAQAAVQTRCLGQIVTSWVIRRAPMENQMLGLALVGQAMRSGGKIDLNSAAGDYEKKRFGRRIGLLEMYRGLGSMLHCLNMTNYGRYEYDQHRIDPPSVEDELQRVGGAPGRAPLAMRDMAMAGMHEAERTLAWLDRTKVKGREIDVLRFSAEEVRYKAWLVYATCEHLAGKRLQSGPIRNQMNRCKRLLRETFANHWTDWTLRDELRYRYGPDEAWLAALGR